MNILILSVLIILAFSSSCVGSEEGGPLMLSPLIESGDVKRAKELSLVQPFDGFDYTSYSGFITTNATYGQNIFFWFFASKNDPVDAPLILYFNGGPGTILMFAVFGEIGPFAINSDMKLVRRKYNWVDSYNVIFADLPAGTGYSYVDDDRGYATTQNEFAEQIVEFLRQFFFIFPQTRHNEFYMAAESYSGLASLIACSSLVRTSTEHNSPLPINFKGYISVSGTIWFPEWLIYLPQELYDMGVIDNKQRDIVQQDVDQIEDYSENGQQKTADDAVNNTFYTIFSYAGNVGLTDYRHIKPTKIVADNYTKFVQQPDIRRRLHVANATFLLRNTEIKNALAAETFYNCKPDVEYILNRCYKVLIMDGNMDLFATPPAQISILYSLNWTGSEDFRMADRTIWRLSENEVAGYVTRANNLIYVTVRNAGHMVPQDRPIEALDAVTRFIYDRPF